MRVWTRFAAAVGLGFALGCSGLTEAALELSGSEVEISEDGDVTMTLPDGTKVETRVKGEPPDDFPLPPPWEGASADSLVITTPPDGEPQIIVSYPLERPRAEVVETYKIWFDENATDVTHKNETVAGIVSEVLVGKLGEGEVLVTVTEAYGANSVSAIWAPGGIE